VPLDPPLRPKLVGAGLQVQPLGPKPLLLGDRGAIQHRHVGEVGNERRPGLHRRLSGTEGADPKSTNGALEMRQSLYRRHLGDGVVVEGQRRQGNIQVPGIRDIRDLKTKTNVQKTSKAGQLGRIVRIGFDKDKLSTSCAGELTC